MHCTVTRSENQHRTRIVSAVLCKDISLPCILMPRESKGAEGDAATRHSRLERIPASLRTLHLGEAHVRTCTLARFPGSGIGWQQEGRNTLSHSHSHASFHIRLHQKESGPEKNFTRSEPRNQCFASSCQPARSSMNCLCVALLPPADHVSTFSRSSLGVDDAGSSFGFTARAFLALDVFVGIVNVNGWTPAPSKHRRI